MLAYRKATGQHVTIAFLTERTQMAAQAGYSKAKWIEFCETMLSRGYNVFLTEAKTTVSKYIVVKHRSKQFRVRFSDHKPIREREASQDCDFFVGKTNFTWTNTAQAIKATIEALESCTDADIIAEAQAAPPVDRALVAEVFGIDMDSCEEADQRQPLDQPGFLHAVSTPSATAGAELDRAGGQTQGTGADHGAGVEP